MQRTIRQGYIEHTHTHTHICLTLALSLSYIQEHSYTIIHPCFRVDFTASIGHSKEAAIIIAERVGREQTIAVAVTR